MEQNKFEIMNICGGCGTKVVDHWLLLLTKLNSVSPEERFINLRFCESCAKKVHKRLKKNVRTKEHS